MPLAEDVKKNDELILHQEKLGYMYGWAEQDKGQFEGVAYFDVSINSEVLPGVSHLTINLNEWDVWKSSDPEGLKKALDSFLTPHYKH